MNRQASSKKRRGQNGYLLRLWIPVEMREKLSKFAEDQYEGNMSLAVRALIREATRK